MRCALASMGFVNEDVQFNQKVIVDTMIKYADEVDIVLFGEAFLQGFYGATFRVEHDIMLAITQDDAIIQDICTVAHDYSVAVSFGFIEKSQDAFYSSQITIDSRGNVVDIFRRVSPGWKETFANEKYREGTGFHSFLFMGQKVAVALCGDLWYDENISEMRQLHPDVVFWPVYTDFNCIEWNESIKYEYAAQAGKIGNMVLYVNSFCKDKSGDEIAKGGSVFFKDGCIAKEIPSGREDVLVVDI
ncbi:MAG: carbon-nitrogen hydrolase family protein [Faecousia sp.]